MNSLTMKDINVVGGFPDDEELWQEVLWCRDNLETLASNEQHFSRLLQLCDRLPSLHSFAAKVLSDAPDSLLERLMEECLVESSDPDDVVDDDTSFVLLANEETRTLNTERFHLFALILTLLGMVTPDTAIRVAQTYLRSASTRFRSAVLTKLAAIPQFADTQLYQAYEKAPEGTRSAILQACLATNHRQGFFELLNDTAWIFFCSSDRVKQSLPDLFLKKRTLEGWKEHRAIFLEFFQQQLIECRGNVLKEGRVWKSISTMLPNSMEDADVFATWKFLEDFRPCFLESTLPPHVQAHLEGLADQNSPESMMRFEGVCRYRKTWEQIRLLSTDSCNDLLQSSIVKSDWELFRTFPSSRYRQFIVKRTQNFHPVEYILKQATADDLWSYIEKKKCSNLFFLSCVQADHLSMLVGQYGLSVDAFWEFSRLHLRSPPELTKDWSRWFLNYHNLSWKMHMSEIQPKIVAAAESTRPIARSRITLYARFVDAMLYMTCRAIETASQVFVVEESVTILTTLRTYYDVLYPHYYGFSSPPPVMANLTERMDNVLLQIVLPRLEALLCFDPSAKDEYIGKNRDKLGVFASWYQSVYKARPSRQILEACLDSLENVVKKAQANKGDEMLPNGRDRFCEMKFDGKLEFVLYATSTHKTGVKQCLGHMETIVKVSDDKALQKRVSVILGSQNYFLGNLLGYLDFCKHLIPELLAKERSNIIRLSHAYLAREPRQGRFSCASSLARLGLLEDVLEGSLLPQALRNSCILAYAGFRNAIVRDSMKESTRARDSDDRVKAHVQWLQAAFISNHLELMQEAFVYTANRIRNEGGHVRPVVYNWLRDNIAQIVVRCLDNDASAPSLSMASELKGLCRSDLDRRDSCGKGVFSEMSRAIVSTVLSFDNQKQIVGVRQIWASCAVELHWNVQQVQVGEQGMPHYNWPIRPGFQVPSSAWISSSTFDKVYHLPSNAASIANLTARINLLKVVQNRDMSTCFGPKEAVEILVTALNTVWKKEYPCSMLGLSKGVLESATLERLLSLFRLCGVAWQENPLLTSIFSQTFSSALERSTKKHLQSASKLLDTIIKIHGEFFHEIRRVRDACELIFAGIVSTWKGDESQKSLARLWLPILLRMRNKENLRNWNLDDGTDPRLLPFLSRYCTGCEPASCCIFKTPAARTAETASYVLLTTKSVFWVPEVRQILSASRPDVYSFFLNLDDPLEGPFAFSSTKENEEKSRLTLVDLKLLGRLPPKVSKAYANFCLEIITDSAFSTFQRTEAMENLMKAPSTSHRDVLKLLKLNLDESLLEALIVKIFSIDSPWHVLASMFTAESIERRPQRMTASLLGHTQKHIHVDTVVKALGFLLEEPRRKSVKVQLHKAIVRLLFESRTDLATQFLGSEWDRVYLHKDVRYLIVELCLVAILERNRSRSVDWELNVLSEVAKDTSTDVETAVLLFTPLWNRTGDDLSQRIHIYFGQHCKDETLRVFLDKWPVRVPISDVDTVRFFGKIYRQLEETTTNSVVQTLAKCQRFAFSNLFMSKPCDDQGILSEVRIYLSDSKSIPCQWDDLTRLFAEFAADVFLDGSLACLIASISALQADRTGKVHDASFLEIAAWSADDSFSRVSPNARVATIKWDAAPRTLSRFASVRMLEPNTTVRARN